MIAAPNNPWATGIMFLDIIGTVCEGPAERGGRFVNTPEDVVMFPAALKMMRLWKASGGRTVGVSNQGGVVMGHISMAQCEAIIARVRQLAVDDKGQPTLFDMIEFCPHHPHANVPSNWGRCWCRKPAPGMLIRAVTRLEMLYPEEEYPAAMALMVGDRDEDRECAARINVDFLTASQWREMAGELG